jgi:hypothetical protein
MDSGVLLQHLSDKECRVLDGEEEDKSEGKVLKEGSEAHQPANQQADCRKKIRQAAARGADGDDQDTNEGKVKEGSSL